MSKTITFTTMELIVARATAEHGQADHVARALCISVATVKAHLQHIREKLGVNTTVQAVTLLCVNGYPQEMDEKTIRSTTFQETNDAS